MATCKNCEAIYSLENHKKCPNCGDTNSVPPLNSTERNKMAKSNSQTVEVKTPTNKTESAVVTHGELDDLFGYGG